MNGEQYAGGTFLPNTTLGKLGRGAKRAATGRAKIGPYEWAPRVGDRRSIWEVFAAYPVALLKNNADLIPAQAIGYFFGRTRAELADLAKRYAAGERWA